LHFSGTIITRIWQFALKRARVSADRSARLAAFKQKLNFYVNISQNWAQLNGGDPNPDQVGSGSFLSDPDPLKSLAVRSSIFPTRRQIGIRVIANPLDLRSLILHLWMNYLTDRSFETADFSMVKRVREP
jgi:hypothetical protein